MTCPSCGEKLDSGRCQDNGEIWCFECSLYPLDVEVREQKTAGTFRPPPRPYRFVMRPAHAWQAPGRERGKA